MSNKKKNNVVNFPSTPSKMERQVEAILFAASEPLDLETIEKRLQSNTNVKKILDKEKPDYLVVQLITSLPMFLILLFDFKTKFILRISGLPRITFFRKILWKLALKKFEYITCPTISTMEYLSNLNIVDRKKDRLKKFQFFL